MMEAQGTMLAMSELKEILPHAKARFVEKMFSHNDVPTLLDDTPLTICNCSNANKNTMRR